MGNQPAVQLIDIQRYEVRQPRGGDHHAARVTTDVTDNAFEFVRHVHDFADVILLVDESLQVARLLNGFLERHAHLEGDQLGKLVRQPIRFALNSGDIAHDGFCRHGTECDDLADRIVAVAFRYVTDHRIPALHAKVHIEVGHGDPFRVQQPLE